MYHLKSDGMSVCVSRTFIVFKMYNTHYRNDPKFSDWQVWVNSLDPDQTARVHHLDKFL